MRSFSHGWNKNSVVIVTVRGEEIQ